MVTAPASGHRWQRLGLSVVVAASTAACAIQPEASPRDIPIEERGVFDAPATGDVAAGTNRIYLLAPTDPDDQQQLRSVLRDVSNDPEELLRSLLSGPNDSEREEGLDTAIPPELELLSARTVGRVLAVDVNDAVNDLTPEGLRLAVAQLITTASELEGVQAVRLRIEGEDQVWPLGDGELTDRPLTVFDYPGLVESSQPTFPPVGA